MVALLLALPVARGAEEPPVVQTVELASARPYFVPTHPRVITTVRFPREIGAPDGSPAVFSEDATSPSAEYAVTWQQGDAYFTITPLKTAGMANLNVPFEGCTYVFYFYPTTDPLKAVAAVNLRPAAATALDSGPVGAAPAEPAITRANAAPVDQHLAPTPARLVGFLDRLKLIHATPIGPRLAELVAAMRVEVAITRAELPPGAPAMNAAPDSNGISGAIATGLNDAGLFQVVLLRAVRDPRLNCIGFACLLRNTSDLVLAFDVNSFGARAGAEYLSQRISDATPILQPGEQSPAYFVVALDRNSPLRADNDWKITVDLVSPRLNPGAAVARGFAPTNPKP